MVKPADYLITNKGDAAVSYPIGYVFGYKSLQRYLGCLFSACYQAISVARHDRLESEGGGNAGKYWYRFFTGISSARNVARQC
jgi:hypothetical protein